MKNKELPIADACLPQAQVAEARAAYNATRPEALQIPADAAKEFYEEPTRVVNVSIDDVGMKKQKLHRKQPRGSDAPPISEVSPTPTASLPEAETPAKKASPIRAQYDCPCSNHRGLVYPEWTRDRRGPVLPGGVFALQRRDLDPLSSIFC